MLRRSSNTLSGGEDRSVVDCAVYTRFQQEISQLASQSPDEYHIPCWLVPSITMTMKNHYILI